MKNWNEENRREGDSQSITTEEYNEVLNNVYKRNKEDLKRFSVVVSCLFVAMFILTFFDRSETQNRFFYLVMVGVGFAFFLLFHLVRDEEKHMVTFINYFFFFVIYIYSTVITLHTPNTAAVAFHIFLVLMPEILIDRPSKIISFLVLSAVGFCWATYTYKPADVAMTDICNAAWVLCLSTVLTIEHVKLRITGLVVRQRIETERDLDSLTGFFSKKASKREIQKKMATNSVGAFVFLDIDNFKGINDTFGHDFGDEVLRKLADYIRSYNHTNEVCGRFGGDEFLVYIPDFDCKEAVFQRVHFLLSNLKNNLDYPELDVHPKLSAGIAFYPEDGTHYDEILRHADAAMYYSKQHGKARVTAYNETGTIMENTK